MLDKTVPMEEALRHIRDGQTIMIGGFGVPGTPFALIDGLVQQGTRQLELIKNDANEAGLGVSKLIEAGRVRKIVTSHLGLNATVIEMLNRGQIQVEFYPQGILAEKIRAGGAGLPGFLTDIGIDTILRDNKQLVTFEGREVIAEPSLRADVALIHAAVADRAGNLMYVKSARNFNPIMAMAADRVIAEAERIVETGNLTPDQVHTPGALVDQVVWIERLTSEYGVLQHHAL